MGFFSKSVPKQQLPWINLTSVEQLNKVVRTTHEKPVLIFKHSTRCGVSSMAFNTFQNQWSSGDSLCDLYYVDLLQHRDVSNEIATLTGIRHESPQVIVLKGDEIIYDASHSSIDARRIESSLRR